MPEGKNSQVYQEHLEALLARILLQMMFVIRKAEIGSYFCLNICRFLCKDAVHLPVLIEDLDGSLISCTELELLPASMVQPRWFKFNKR